MSILCFEMPNGQHMQRCTGCAQNIASLPSRCCHCQSLPPVSARVLSVPPAISVPSVPSALLVPPVPLALSVPSVPSLATLQPPHQPPSPAISPVPASASDRLWTSHAFVEFLFFSFLFFSYLASSDNISLQAHDTRRPTLPNHIHSYPCCPLPFILHFFPTSRLVLSNNTQPTQCHCVLGAVFILVRMALFVSSDMESVLNSNGAGDLLPPPSTTQQVNREWVLFHPVYSPEELKAVEVSHDD